MSRQNGSGIGIFTWILFAVAVAMLLISAVNRYTGTSLLENVNQSKVKESAQVKESTLAKETEKSTKQETQQETQQESVSESATETSTESQMQESTQDTANTTEMLKYINENESLYTDSLVSLANRYEEAIPMVYEYATNKDEAIENIDISSEYKQGEIPIFLQFDKRWGRKIYGINPMGVSGCGPTSISMVYVGLTGDTTKNPAEVAEFCLENNYYVKGAGTSWKLMTTGAKKLGLNASKVKISKERMISELQDGHVLIASVKAGDFADSGHFIVINSYDESEDGFYVHNSLRTSDSKKVWDYETLKGQFKAMWSYSYEKN
ncbi:hypothetical protein P261_01495 [Lachnospiraceae bacterium TWA4]|nr:hypothetical protein P261_01495 [Lachnospiraceae bacterium TWA4]